MPSQSPTAAGSLRHFNRFYTAEIGALDRDLLGSGRSLSEARVLFELAHNDELTASDFVGKLGIDGGYLSRMLSGFEKEGLLEQASGVGRRLRDGLAHPHVREVRGRGLLIGLDLDRPVAPAVVTAAGEHGFILNAPTPERIRLAPPLVLTADQADAFLAAWPAVLADAYGAEGAEP